VKFNIGLEKKKVQADKTVSML